MGSAHRQVSVSVQARRGQRASQIWGHKQDRVSKVDTESRSKKEVAFASSAQTVAGQIWLPPSCQEHRGSCHAHPPPSLQHQWIGGVGLVVPLTVIAAAAVAAAAEAVRPMQVLELPQEQKWNQSHCAADATAGGAGSWEMAMAKNWHEHFELCMDQGQPGTIHIYHWTTQPIAQE
eukprot:1148073-Pelagomonas_calceolata.AAC.6